MNRKTPALAAILVLTVAGCGTPELSLKDEGRLAHAQFVLNGWRLGGSSTGGGTPYTNLDILIEMCRKNPDLKDSDGRTLRQVLEDYGDLGGDLGARASAVAASGCE